MIIKQFVKDYKMEFNNVVKIANYGEDVDGVFCMQSFEKTWYEHVNKDDFYIVITDHDNGLYSYTIMTDLNDVPCFDMAYANRHVTNMFAQQDTVWKRKVINNVTVMVDEKYKFAYTKMTKGYYAFISVMHHNGGGQSYSLSIRNPYGEEDSVHYEAVFDKSLAWGMYLDMVGKGIEHYI